MADKQIFIRIENFNDTVDVIELIRGKIRESRGILQKVKQLNAQEDDLISKWNNELDEVERRFSYVTDSFSETTGE